MATRLKHERVGAAISILGTILTLVALIGLPGRATADSTAPTNQLAGEGESWPEGAVRALQNDAATASALGGLQPVYTAGRGEDPSRQDFVAGYTDFAVSEAPLTSSEASTAQQNGITPAYVPYALGGVSILAALNVDFAHGGQLITNLKLTIPTLAKIFTHYIGYWDNPEILAENPDVPGLKTLGADQILTVVRRDSSSTSTALVSAFLANPTAKPIWEAYAKGLGQAPDSTPDTWPADTNVNTTGVTSGEKGAIDAALSLDPVTEKPVPGVPLHSIAYVATSFAQQYGGPLAAIQNEANPPTYVLPTDTGALTSAAASGGTFDSASHLYTFDYGKMTGTGAYPIPLASYWIVPLQGASAAKAAALSAFMKFVLSPAGQADVVSNGMVGVPATVLAAAASVLPSLDSEATTTTTESSTTTTLAAGTTTIASGGGGATTSSTPAGATPTTGASGAATAHASVAAAATGSGGGAGGGVTSPSSAQLPFTGGGSLPLLGFGLALVAGGQLGRRRAARRPG